MAKMEVDLATAAATRCLRASMTVFTKVFKAPADSFAFAAPPRGENKSLLPAEPATIIGSASPKMRASHVKVEGIFTVSSKRR